jgi:hypothetical protein
MPPRESEREEITITRENGPGLWVCAKEAILKHHGFSDVKSGQRKLVIWLWNNYKDMLEDPDTQDILQLFFKQGSRITIPGKKETAEIIGLAVTSGMTATGEVQVLPRLSDIKVLDMEGNEITDNKWAMGKPLVVSVTCRNGGEWTKVKFAVYQKKNDVGYEKAPDELEGTKTEGEDRYTVEWKYEYSGEELKSKPKILFKAYGDEIEEIAGNEIEIGMDIKLVVVDDDNVVLGKAKIDIEFTKNDQKDKQGNQSKKFSDLEADSEGKYQWEGLIPDQVAITVRTPIERPYPVGANGELKKHTVKPDTDKVIDTLSKIDGSEPIKNKIASTSQNQAANTNQNPVHELDMGKLNVVKLPVRYLNKTTANISVPNRASMTECQFIEYILGSAYHNTPVDIPKVQIYKGLPSPKQLKELINKYQVSLTDPRFSSAISSEQSIGGMMAGTPAISLPNGIIYIPLTIGSPDQKALFVHEVFHQFQYTHGVLNNIDIFKGLIQEMWDDKTNPNYDPYDYRLHAGLTSSDPLTDILSLEQIVTLEGRAQFIEDFVLTVYGQRQILLSDFIPAFKTNRNRSGINTRVIL